MTDDEVLRLRNSYAPGNAVVAKLADEALRRGKEIQAATKRTDAFHDRCAQLEAALRRAHACATLNDNGQCAGCFVSEALEGKA